MSSLLEKIEKSAAKEQQQQQQQRQSTGRQHHRPGLQEIEDDEDNDHYNSSNGVDASSYIQRNREESQRQHQEEEEEEDHRQEEDPTALDAYLVAEEGEGNNSRRRRKGNVQVVDAVIEQDNQNSTTRNKWTSASICLMVLLLLAATIIDLSVVLPTKRSSTNIEGDSATNNNNNNGVQTTEAPTNLPPSVLTMTTENPSLVPTMIPTVSPSMSLAPTSEKLDLILEEIRRQFLDSIPTLETDLQTRSSPQYQAALWMAQDDVSNFTIGLEFPLNATNIDLLVQFRQRYALGVFYYSTNGDQWLDQCNFMNPTGHVCDWNCPWPVDKNPAIANYVEAGYTFAEYMGVECSDGYVISMEFALNDLSGTLPNELQGLDILGSLILPNNNIQGTIPFMTFNDTLAHRVYGVIVLSNLVLYANQFTGSFPDNIDELTNLRVIWVGSNYLSGTLPSSLGNLPLLFIFADSNLLTGPIPSSLMYESPDRESPLQLINLSYNALTGSLPNEIVLPSLSQLALSDNAMMSGTLPAMIGNSSNLALLDLSYNAFSGTILPESIKGLTTLQILALFDNQFTGDGLNWEIIGGMRDLLTFSVGNNHISGVIPTQIGDLEQLFRLDIGHSDYYEQDDTFITGTLPSEFGNLHMLDFLIVSRNRITGTVPTELGNLSSLRHLGLNSNEFTGTIPTELNKLTTLATLSIQETGLVGSLDELCATQESSQDWRQGYSADCLEGSVNCSCCTLCCNNVGYCEQK